MISIISELILDFPDSRQPNDYTCGISVAQDILAYYGINERPDILIKKTTVTPKNGMDPEDIVSLLSKYDLQAITKKMTIQDVINYINNNIPVILSIQAWGDRNTDYNNSYCNGHYIIAIGYDNNQIIFDDPSLISNRGSLSFDDLEERWHDTLRDGTKYDHLGIIVIGKPKYDSSRILPIQ